MGILYVNVLPLFPNGGSVNACHLEFRVESNAG